MPVIDRFLKDHPYTHLGVVVDDVQVLTIGTPKFCEEVGSIVARDLLAAMGEAKFPLSVPKLVLLSSDPVVGSAVCIGIPAIKDAHKTTTRNLGVDFKLTRKRERGPERPVLKSRLVAVRRRTQTARQFRKLGADLAGILQQGLRFAALYGSSIAGLSAEWRHSD